MITVQETTAWDTDYHVPNHKYIMSDDMRKAYGYIKEGELYPQLFNKPLEMSWTRRKYKVLVKTDDITDEQVWRIEGSKGNKYKVRLVDGLYSCTCPAGHFRGHCKHIEKVKDDGRSD